MSTQDIRLTIDQILDGTNDKDLLQTYLSVLKTLVKFRSQQIVGYNVEGNPITAADLEKQADEAVQRVKAGNFINQKDLMKEVENW